MSETVRNSINKAMGRPVDKAPRKESVRETLVKSISALTDLAGHLAPEDGPTKTKEEAHYGEGTKTEYCGNCEHYQVKKKDGCEIVKGFIEYEKWCRYWDEKPDETVWVDQ